MRRSVPAIMATLLLVGCGGGSQTAGTASPSTSSASASSTPTPTGPSVAQVASVVAQGQASMEKLKSDLEKNCDYSNPLACALDVQRAPLEAQVLIKKLGAFTTYPPEIESLAKQTLEDAQTLADVDVSDCEKDADSAGCAGLHVAVMSQVDTMLETLAGWKPYQ